MVEKSAPGENVSGQENIPAEASRPCKNILTNPWLFYGAGILLLFCMLGARSLWGSEGRWAEIAREMVLRNDYFHPTINWAPYFDKPLFTYWVIVAASWITGTINEFTARLPNAVAGLGALWATAFLGTRLFSRHAGYTAAWLLLNSFGFLFWSRTACADMENVAFILFAVLWYRLNADRADFSRFLVFYLICAVGAHFKGLPAVVLPVALCLADAVPRKTLKRYFTLSHFTAMLIGVSVYLLPFIYAAYTGGGYGENGLYLAFKENILRFFNAFDHREPFYVYLYYVPILFLPWAPLLMAALARAFRRYKYMSRDEKWILHSFLIIFFIYTISESRRSYYILPILPFCALIVGNFLARAAADTPWIKTSLRIQGWLITAACVLLILAPASGFFLEELAGIVPPEGLTISLCITGILGFLFSRLVSRALPHKGQTFDWCMGLLPSLGAVVIILAGFFCWQQVILEQYRPYKPFLKKVRTAMGGNVSPSNVALSQDTANVIFYLGFNGPMPVLKTPKTVEAFLDRDGLRYMIVQRRYLKRSFSVLPEELKKHPFMSSPLYPGQKRKKMQLLVWRLQGPVDNKKQAHH